MFLKPAIIPNIRKIMVNHGFVENLLSRYTPI